MKRAWATGRFVLRELGRLAGIFALGSLLVFSAIHAMEGDPVALRMKKPDPARVAEIRAELGLDDPMVVQYGRYLGEFVTGDWGRSIVSGRPVAAEIARYLPATLELGLAALLLGSFGGIALVLVCEASGWRGLRRLSGGLGALGLTVPIYWIGLVLVVVFAVGLGWLPVSGRYDFTRLAPEGTGFLLLDALRAGDPGALGTAVRHLALPVATLALYPAALVAGTLEARLHDPRLQQLLVALRSRGFGPWRIWGWHVLRLLGAPLVTVIGTNIGALMGGAVLTETVFAWPGMGRFLVEGVLNRDLFVIQHGLLLVVLLAAVAVTLADFAARAMDPAQARGRGGAA
jgi:ABC-type dipeptide/oligopeptide/nickel transport system permease component